MRDGSGTPFAGSGGDVAVSGRRRGSGAKTATVARAPPSSCRAASTVSCRISSTVSVLDPRDLADLAVAAVHALEDRQALAQEVRGRLQRRVGQAAALPERRAQRRVVGFGEVEHAEVRGHGLAPDVIGGAELALATSGEVRGERSRVGRRQSRRPVRATLLHQRKPSGACDREGGR
jgi:hypothetical protein